jgi:signal transduction histidine kinase
MLTNLLDNAVSHTPAGGRVTVSLRMESPWIVLEVADTGPGIPPADRHRIFERFVRLDTNKRSGSGGAGLGLPIARWIAEAHGGTLTLAADANANATTPAGSRFVVHLPLDRPVPSTSLLIGGSR